MTPFIKEFNDALATILFVIYFVFETIFFFDEFFFILFFQKKSQRNVLDISEYDFSVGRLL